MTTTVEIPEPGTTWRKYNGGTYRVTGYATFHEPHGPIVLCRLIEGKGCPDHIYKFKASDWHEVVGPEGERRFTPLDAV